MGKYTKVKATWKERTQRIASFPESQTFGVWL